MGRMIFAAAAMALLAGCGDSGGADADGDGNITAQEAAAEAAGATVLVSGSLCDSRIDNVIIHPPGVEALTPASGEENLRNVSVGGVVKLAAEETE